ncbi:MAG: hypothetical protein ACRC1T_09740 [Clostridium chrysemydis]|uniref:hypothetical protein n=1 Tax=Clostridium chrysemydis TaxID=2665504 RepID=UPI003F2F6F15
METYKEIDWIDSATKYFVADSGNVYSLKKDGSMYLLKQKIDKYGYCSVGLMVKGGKKIFLVHRLVAMAFIKNDNPNVKTTVNHIDNVKTNNHVSNLEWMSVADNNRYRFKCGYNVDGIKNRSITDEDAIKILRLFYFDNVERIEIKNMFKDKYDRRVIESVLNKRTSSLSKIYLDLNITDDMVKNKKGFVSKEKEQKIYEALFDFYINKMDRKIISVKYGISINMLNRYITGDRIGHILEKFKKDYNL